MNPCESCGGKIVGRSETARFCIKCYRKREYLSRNEKALYQVLAMSFVTAAIRHGDLPKLDGSIPCVDCGAAAVHYDHRDYKHPLAVDPVCRSCNARRGPGLHKDPRETGKKPPTIVKRFRARERAA